jgi:hypothetical protein
VAVLEGDSVTLVCGTDLTGNPIPTVVWRDSSGSEVSSGGRFTLSSGREVVSITVNITNREDAGNWTCTAQVYENGTGSLTVGGPVEVSVQLVVVVAPSAPEDVTVEQVGSTWISLSWFQSTRGIPPLSRHMILVMGGGENRSVSEESSEMAANVTGLLPGTEYMFRVVAVSEFRGVQALSPPSDSVPGTTETSVPAPVCSETPRADDDRLVVSWTYTHTGGLAITSVDVFFNPDTSPELRQAFSSVPGAVVEDVSSEEREYSIPLPEAGLHYQFTVRAENRVGASEVDCPVTRLDTGIPSRPDPPIVDSGSGSVVVMVTTQHSGVRDNAVDEFRFILKIRNAADPSQDPIQRNESVPGCITGACSASVSLSSEDGLVEGVSYIVEVGAVNRYGESAVSGNSEPFEIDVPGAVSNIRVDADVETVTLLWDVAPSNGAAISSYTVTVFLDSQQVYTGMSVDTSLSVTRNEFQDQEDTRRDTEYQVTVSAVNSVGSGEEVTETLTIPSGLPGSVTNLQVDIDGDNITMQWDAPSINGDNITSYTVMIFANDEPVYTAEIDQGTSVTLTRTDLQAPRDMETMYDVTVVANNLIGPGLEADIRFTLPAESAAPPESAVSKTVAISLLVFFLSLITMG